MKLRFAVDGVEYEYENTLVLAEAMLIKQCTGYGAGRFIQEVMQMDGAALAAMVLLAKMRAGEDTTWADLASLDLVKLIESVGMLNDDDDDSDAAKDADDAGEADSGGEPEPGPSGRPDENGQPAAA